MTPWTEEERAWAAECLAEGDSAAEIAAWSGRAEADVRAELGIVAYTPTKRELEILALWAEGELQETIAARYRITAERVRQILRRLRRLGCGAALRPQGHRPSCPRPRIAERPFTALERACLDAWLAGDSYSTIQARFALTSRGLASAVVYRARIKARRDGVRHERGQPSEAIAA